MGILDVPGISRAESDRTYAKVGIFENFSDQNFRKYRAALARQRAGLSACRVSVLGDSNSNGFQQPDGANYLRSYGYRAMQILDGEYGPSRPGLVYTRIGHSGAFARPDNRITIGAGWTQLNSSNYGPAGMGALLGAGPTGGSLTYTADVDCNTFDVWFRTSTDSPSDVRLTINGQPTSDVVLAADTFAGDGALTVTEVGNQAWQTFNPEGGTWSRESGQLKATKLGNSTRMYAVVDVGRSDGRLSVKRSANIFDGVVFRRSDLTNYWVVAQNGSSQYLLAKVVNGSTTTVATSTLVAAAGDVVSVELAGASIAVKVNGTQAPNLTASDAFNLSATMFGVRLANGGGNAFFDNFSFAIPYQATVDLNGAEGVKKVTVGANTIAKHALGITAATSGSVAVLAIEAYDSTKTGLRWTLAGYSGGKATEWNTASAIPAGNQGMTFTVGAPDLVVVNLMINAHNANQSTSAYKAEMSTFITACKAAGDVILIASPPAGNGSTTTWAGYLGVLREIAQEKGCGLINMQDRWGAYSVANAEPYRLWNDADHPSVAGYWDLGQALADGLRLAAGRSV